MKPVSVVFLDIDDTLYSTTEFTEKARYNAINEMIRVGLDIDSTRCYDILDEIVREFTSNDSHHFDKLLHRLPEQAKKKINPLVVIAAGVSGYHNTKFIDLKPFPDVAEYLPKIAALPVKLGIISSGLGIKQAEKLVRLELYRYFDNDLIFITDEIGIGKRNPELFKTACSRAGAEPSSALHAGDNPATDIDTAHEAGLVTVLRQGAGKHADEISRYDPDFRIRDFSELFSIISENI